MRGNTKSGIRPDHRPGRAGRNRVERRYSPTKADRRYPGARRREVDARQVQLPASRQYVFGIRERDQERHRGLGQSDAGGACPAQLTARTIAKSGMHSDNAELTRATWSYADDSHAKLYQSMAESVRQAVRTPVVGVDVLRAKLPQNSGASCGLNYAGAGFWCSGPNDLMARTRFSAIFAILLDKKPRASPWLAGMPSTCKYAYWSEFVLALPQKRTPARTRRRHHRNGR